MPGRLGRVRGPRGPPNGGIPVARSARTAVRAVALISILGGCTAASTPSGSVDPASSGSAAPVAVRSDAPSSTPSASGSAALEPSAAPTPSPTPDPTPTRVPADAPWSEPVRVLNDTCWGLTATIDDLGRYHIAAKCGDELRYVRWYPGAIDLHQDSSRRPLTGSNTARSWRPTVTTCSWPTRGTPGRGRYL